MQEPDPSSDDLDVPDLASCSDEDLAALIDRLAARESTVSHERRILHGKIDILRAEMVNRIHLQDSPDP